MRKIGLFVMRFTVNVQMIRQFSKGRMFDTTVTKELFLNSIVSFLLVFRSLHDILMPNGKRQLDKFYLGKFNRCYGFKANQINFPNFSNLRTWTRFKVLVKVGLI
jgi:hypothetical protein